MPNPIPKAIPHGSHPSPSQQTFHSCVVSCPLQTPVTLNSSPSAMINPGRIASIYLCLSVAGTITPSPAPPRGFFKSRTFLCPRLCLQVLHLAAGGPGRTWKGAGRCGRQKCPPHGASEALKGSWACLSPLTMSLQQYQLFSADLGVGSYASGGLVLRWLLCISSEQDCGSPHGPFSRSPCLAGFPISRWLIPDCECASLWSLCAVLTQRSWSCGQRGFSSPSASFCHLRVT